MRVIIDHEPTNCSRPAWRDFEFLLLEEQPRIRAIDGDEFTLCISRRLKLDACSPNHIFALISDHGVKAAREPACDRTDDAVLAVSNVGFLQHCLPPLEIYRRPAEIVYFFENISGFLVNFDWGSVYQ